jgi:hypothetical protein
MCELDARVRPELLDLQHTLSESCRRTKPNRSLGTRDTNIYSTTKNQTDAVPQEKRGAQGSEFRSE